jgi:hypothetical protein
MLPREGQRLGRGLLTNLDPERRAQRDAKARFGQPEEFCEVISTHPIR